MNSLQRRGLLGSALLGGGLTAIFISQSANPLFYVVAGWLVGGHATYTYIVSQYMVKHGIETMKDEDLDPKHEAWTDKLFIKCFTTWPAMLLGKNKS